MIIEFDKILTRRARNQRINKLKEKLIQLDNDLENFEALERKQEKEIISPHTFYIINKYIPSINIKESTKRNLALDILEYAKKHHSLITYKNCITIAEYLKVGNKKLKYKSFLKFIEFKKRIKS